MANPDGRSLKVARHLVQRGWATVDAATKSCQFFYTHLEESGEISLQDFLYNEGVLDAKRRDELADELPRVDPLALTVDRITVRVDPAHVLERKFFENVSAAETATAGGEPARGELRAGSVLGDYEIVEELGRGGMGIIYKAKKQNSGRLFAVKTWTAASGPGEASRRARFQREVEALRRLDHDHIVSVRGCGREAGVGWYAMDYVEGSDLQQVLEDSPPSMEVRFELFLQILRAVQHAHERGVIHRDLKPSNVIVDEQGKAFVVDFGLAKLTGFGAEELSLTQSGVALGTLLYMSPEQLRNSKRVDWRTDVFSLGTMLYEILTLNHPFMGETANEVATKILEDRPLPPSRLNSELGPNLDRIVLRALEKSPESRYQELHEFRHDLLRYMRGASIKWKGPSLGERAAKTKRYLREHTEPLAIGFILATMVWIPLWVLVQILTNR